jgi:hypothetical protein
MGSSLLALALALDWKVFGTAPDGTLTIWSRERKYIQIILYLLTAVVGQCQMTSRLDNTGLITTQQGSRCWYWYITSMHANLEFDKVVVYSLHHPPWIHPLPANLSPRY